MAGETLFLLQCPVLLPVRFWGSGKFYFSKRHWPSHCIHTPILPSYSEDVSCRKVPEVPIAQASHYPCGLPAIYLPAHSAFPRQAFWESTWSFCGAEQIGCPLPTHSNYATWTQTSQASGMKKVALLHKMSWAAAQSWTSKCWHWSSTWGPYFISAFPKLPVVLAPSLQLLSIAVLHFWREELTVWLYFIMVQDVALGHCH